MIVLKEIKLINFLSHQKSRINFRLNQKLLIDGKSGSGKSTVLDALVWVLYGRGRADNRSLIKRGEKTAKVDVILADDDKYYKIKRVITSKGKHSLSLKESKDGKKYTLVKVTGVKETQDYIEKKILHSSYLLFINSIVYPQDNADTFVKQNASKRKELLMEIINADSYDEHLKKTKEILKDNETKLVIANSEIGQRTNIIEENEEEASKLKQYKEKEAKINDKLEKAEEKIDKNMEAKRANDKIVITAEAKNAEIIKNTSEVDIKQESLEELNKVYIKLQTQNVDEIVEKVELLKKKRVYLLKIEVKRDAIIKWKDEYSKIVAEQPIGYNYDNDISELNRRIINIQTEKIENCPVINKACPLLEKKQEDRVREFEKDLEDKTTRKKTQGEELAIFNKQIEELGKAPEFDEGAFTQLRAEISTLEPYQEKYEQSKQVEQELKIIEEKITTAKQDIKKIKEDKITLENDFEKLRESIRTKELLDEQTILITERSKLRSEHDENIKNTVSAQAAVNIIKNSKEELKKAKIVVKKLSGNVENLTLLKDAFGPNGIKAIVIDYTIPRLEDKINDILGRLSDFRVRLDTQKQAISNENTIEGLFITIINDMGEELDYELFSGGEKIKISIAINESLAGISKIDFRILDEAIVSLDSESTEQFIETILMIQDQISQIICISHINEIKDIFEDKMMVKKINGDSVIVK